MEDVSILHGDSKPRSSTNTQVFLIPESKLDDRFVEGQYIIDGYHAIFRFDGIGNGGGLLLYVQEDIPT